MKYLYFTADWCASCRAIAPLLDELVEGLPEGVTLEKIDVDKDPEKASDHHIKKLPTVIKLDSEGNEVSRLMGANTLKAYQEM